MYTAKASMMMLALVAGVALVQAAGGIKGQRPDDSQQRLSGLKGPRAQQQQQQQQQQYLPPPQQLPQQPIQQQRLPAAPLPPRPAPAKGAGQVAPIFQAVRVQAPVQQQQVVIQQLQQEPEFQQQQQQQQETDIEPTGAAQDSDPSILAPAPAAAPAAAAGLAAGSEAAEEANPRPEPYAFTYAFESGDSATSGSSQREEQQDASGKVTGFYTLKGEDGRDRRVDYVADANGFRATISTNEMGTAAKDSADVDWQAQSPSDAQLRVAESATQAARQRALLNPQPLASGSSQSSNKVTSPRQNAAAAAATQQRESFAASSKSQQQVLAEPAQLQEPFEQIRQVELNARARKSRHAPFYLFTI